MNADPHGDGWMLKIKVESASDLDGLMDAEAYDAFITEA